MPERLPVYLDRDGVINENRDDYVRSLTDWVPIPGSIEAAARLARAGHPVIVVTNQSAVARGYCTAVDVETVNAALRAAVAEAGGTLAGVYCCPHAPGAGCSCRKPATGMIDQARAELGLPPGGWLVGDAATDMEMGRRAGLRTILVLTGRGRRQLAEIRSLGEPEPWRTADDLSDAVGIILGERGGTCGLTPRF